MLVFAHAMQCSKDLLLSARGLFLTGLTDTEALGSRWDMFHTYSLPSIQAYVNLLKQRYTPLKEGLHFKLRWAVMRLDKLLKSFIDDSERIHPLIQ